MKTDIVIIGAGAVGLAIARKCAESGHGVILLEKESNFGQGSSSRSSEVVHAGIYYHTGSLKASLCVQGRAMLYEHCRKHGIKHKKTGKLFVAVNENELHRLEATRKQALINGVTDVRLISSIEVKALEPELKAVGALHSPSSGIFDTHGFMKSLLDLGKKSGMIFAVNSPVSGANKKASCWEVQIEGDCPITVKCDIVVNSAGLDAINMSNKVFPGRKVPEPRPTKGSYLRLSGKEILRHIVYPAIMPSVIEERVDATPDLGGSLRFGPNIEKTGGLTDFSVNPKLVDMMIGGIRRYLPNIDALRLHPDCAGIRPKICTVNGGVEDFTFDWAPQRGWLDLWGIESPGLTASLAIAEHVYMLIKDKGLL